MCATAKALVRLRECTGSPEPLLVAYAVRMEDKKCQNLMSWLNCLQICHFDGKSLVLWLEISFYHKIPKISDTRTLAVITLKV